MRSLMNGDGFARLSRWTGRIFSLGEETGETAPIRQNDLAQTLIDSLALAHKSDTLVTMRDVDKLTGLPQPVALRLIDDLRQQGLVEVDREEFDAFGAKIRLTTAGREQIS